MVVSELLLGKFMMFFFKKGGVNIFDFCKIDGDKKLLNNCFGSVGIENIL